MEDQARTRTQRGRYLRWIGLGIVLAGWGVVRLWQRRGMRCGRFSAPSSAVVPPPVPPTQPEPIEIPNSVTPSVPEASSEPETPSAFGSAPEAVEFKDTDNLLPDDLCRIAGIGPKVAALLGTAGVTTFAQLASTTPERLREDLQAAGLRFMSPDTWPEQANLAAQGNWEALAALQAELKGGRRV
ncbi:MAG: DUF4332 domain-containing protein [Anaerolineae bacterium]|nr:DUF4332 domain-containing protein [Anaerolineae bacterium]